MDRNERERLIKEKAAGQADQLTAWRRHLHANPELSFQEKNTTAFLDQQLREWGLEPVRRTPTGLWADIVGSGHEGADPEGLYTVAVRADIDALPILEQNTFDFRSTNDGVMHACGHDGHTAILLGVARTLLDMRDAIPGRIRLLFQPAEELPPGGARQLMDAGCLEGVDKIIGLHLWSPLEVGKAAVRSGPTMAAADNFTVKVVGKGGHGAQPHQTVDAIMVAAQIAVALQQVVSRTVDPLKPAVLTLGTFHAGTASNIIAQEAELTGTVRTFDEDTQQTMQAAMERIVREVAAAFGAKGDLVYERGYPALVNDPEVTGVFERTVRDVMGEDAFLTPEPIMGGEDFASYLKERQGAFLFVGAGNDAIGANFPHHHPNFTVDERALPDGVAVLTATALRLLEAASLEVAAD